MNSKPISNLIDADFPPIKDECEYNNCSTIFERAHKAMKNYNNYYQSLKHEPNDEYHSLQLTKDIILNKNFYLVKPEPTRKQRGGPTFHFYNISEKKEVSIKFIKNNQAFIKELHILRQIKQVSQSDITPPIAMLHESFTHNLWSAVVFDFSVLNLQDAIYFYRYSLNIKTVKYVTEQIGLALMFLDKINISHCDICPENILTDFHFNTFKLTNFESAQDLNDQQIHIPHAFQYRAPEALLNLKLYRTTDIWCLGITLCEMIYGVIPFETDHHKIKLYKIMELCGYPSRKMYNESAIAQSILKKKLFGKFSALKPVGVEGQIGKPGTLSAENFFSRLAERSIYSILNDDLFAKFKKLAMKMLRIDPTKRISADDILGDEFCRYSEKTS